MLRNIKGLIGYKIHATDGEMGNVAEFYFDDRTWRIRYLVVATGGRLSGREVLISPAALRTPDWGAKVLPVDLTQEQVRNSPDIDTKKTVTRRHELELHRHYAWPVYWGEGVSTGRLNVYFPPDEEEGAEERPEKPSPEEARLQSTRSVTGYRLHAVDGPIGHVDDFIIDDAKWAIRYLVADAGIWLAGRKVLISPHWAESVSWETSEIFVDLTQEAIRNSPGYDPSVPVSGDYESRLYDHYGRPKFEAEAARASRRAAKH